MQVQTTLFRENLGEIEAIADCAGEIGALALNLFFLVCTGRGVTLTQHGEGLYARARKMLKINAEIMDEFTDEDLAGKIHFGLPDDYAVRLLPAILKITLRREQKAHPPSLGLGPLPVMSTTPI